jgi:hypothetical protein
MSVSDRVARVAAVVESLEREMELLCLTGVEDRLQDRVRPTLELLRNAGIKVWCTAHYYKMLICWYLLFNLKALMYLNCL